MIEWVARRCATRGLRTALLTNNVREWEPLWRAKLPELDDIFEVVVDSAFVGMRKPEPAIYDAHARPARRGVEAADCLFVDDLELNCETARALGHDARSSFQHAEPGGRRSSRRRSWPTSGR